MALFKFAGTKEQLDTVATHNGFVYVCADGVDADESGNLLGEWFVDIGNTRYRLAAAALIDPNGEIVNVNDLVLQGDILEVSQGGLGRNTVTQNALLVGGKNQDNEDIVAEIPAAAGVLQAANAETTPNYGTVPVIFGGTGATTAAQARGNLDVFSKTEVDTRAVSVSYTATLLAENWVEDSENEVFTYTLRETRLMCGNSGLVPPLITYTSNEEEYSEINGATATPGVGITFTAENKPTENIGIIIVDNK